MKTKNKLMQLYKDCCKNGKLPNLNGLCNELAELGIPLDNLHLFMPSVKEMQDLSDKGMSTVFWLGDTSSLQHRRYEKFNPLRETVLCFLIAMEK